MAKKKTKSVRSWTRDPHSGGVKVPADVQRETVLHLERHAAARYAGKYERLDIRFRGSLCYLDAYIEPAEPSPRLLELRGETREEYFESMRAMPVHLCRLRYFGPDRWSLAFYTYSNEQYKPCFFPNGTFYGTPEEGLEVGAMYLRG